MIAWLATTIGMILLIILVIFKYLRYTKKLDINFKMLITIDDKKVTILESIKSILTSIK